jgi:peptidoglycan/LPS O-acetylase OafA/YrhL
MSELPPIQTAANSTVPRPPTNPRAEDLRALTSLRFFAAMYVLGYHYTAAFDLQSAATSLGYTGVTFFFILSGFILTHNYRNADFGSETVKFNYFAARFCRIYPVFLFSLLVSLPFFLAYTTKIPAFSQQALYLSGALLAPLGLHAWVAGAACSLNCPSWSISAELFFYLIFPLAVRLIAVRPWAWLIWTALGWLLTCFIFWAVWLWIGSGIPLVDTQPTPASALVAQFIKFFPLGRLPEFLIGIVLYYLWCDRTRRPSTGLLLALCLLFAAVLSQVSGRLPDVFLHNGLTALVWVPLIAIAAGLRGGPLCAPPMVFLGQISYSLYLLHIPVLSIVLALDKRLVGGALSQDPVLAVVITGFVALLASAAVFLWLEEPARRHFRMLFSRRGGIAAGFK